MIRFKEFRMLAHKLQPGGCSRSICKPRALFLGMLLLTLPSHLACQARIERATAQYTSPYPKESANGLRIQQLHGELERIAARASAPGFSVGVVIGGEIAFLGGYGVMDLKSRVPVDPDSIFNVASISKTFTATALMQLAEQGKVRLDAPVTIYLPEFRMKDERFRDITVRHLLTHEAGLEHGRFNPWATPRMDDGALSDKLAELKSKKLKFAPGSAYLYSNWGFCLAGGIVARVTGMSFEASLHERILAPLKMTSSSFDFRNLNRSRLTHPHPKRFFVFGDPVSSDTYPCDRSWAPKGGLFSSAADLCQWLKVALDRGSSGTLLTQAGWEAMWDASGRRSPNMGLGWFVNRNLKGNRAVTYLGESLGYGCRMVILPEQGMGYVILYNATPEAKDPTATALQAALGELR
jgi:CubicO group peptidase (beta-lactamase class C family)